MQKTAKICSKIQGLTQILDCNFKTVKDNSNLKQIWTMGIVSLHFWRISFLSVWGQLRSIFPIGHWVRKSVFLSYCYIFFAHSKTTQPICTKFPGIVHFHAKQIIAVFLNYSSALLRRYKQKIDKISIQLMQGLTQSFDCHFKMVKGNWNR